jgi:hypothetical protein
MACVTRPVLSARSTSDLLRINRASYNQTRRFSCHPRFRGDDNNRYQSESALAGVQTDRDLPAFDRADNRCIDAGGVQRTDTRRGVLRRNARQQSP